ncbi:MAG: hypothetical protein ABFS41_06420 [Myxococcota bacterium]
MKARIGHEMREYAITSLYLFVWLLALLLYENALRGEHGLAALPFGVAVAKALVLGKFVLLGQALGAGTHLAARTLAHRIAWRSLGLLLVVLVLKVIEEVVVGLVNGDTATKALAELTSRPLELGAGALLMLLVLVPFVAFKQLSLALGPGRLRSLLLSPEDAEQP